ncbi:hypothetical protein N183_35310 [Sinorhizobium sp. Sb3]|nr:hypothetical protein N183_35310 [Sinorhizobium sp. Sb3]
MLRLHLRTPAIDPSLSRAAWHKPGIQSVAPPRPRKRLAKPFDGYAIVRQVGGCAYPGAF